MREEGYYWVKLNENWIIARWYNDAWYLAGFVGCRFDIDFEEIDEKRLTHE